MNLKIGASVGVAVYPDDTDNIDQLIERADLQMYEQKRQRKITSAVA